jgi:predicted DCC family thiol-disulfide oxidoreductase YuxK
MPTILLFDGVCNLCNGAVRWIIPRDPHGNIHFASLQSATGQALAAQHGIDTSTLSTIVLIHAGTAYTASDAALFLCTQLVWPWPLLAPLRIVPRFIRNAVYYFVARNRYRWFGQSESCMLPFPAYQSRFLEK